jgi:putative chitinase
MAAALDLKAFFAAGRANPFPGSLSASQVTGMEAILSACPPDTPLEHLAYGLGTCPIETAWTMLPIREKGSTAYLTRMYDINGARPAKARELGNLKPGDGTLFCGRGYVQLTGRSNYRRATTRLRALGFLGAGQDLEASPDLAMHPDIAAAILFIGTREGWFTGKKLSDYLGSGKNDWTGARRIINGQDRASEIAQHAQGFAAALRKAGYRPGAVTQAVPVPPVTVEPLPAPAAGPVVAPAPRRAASPASTAPIPTVPQASPSTSLLGRILSRFNGKT